MSLAIVEDVGELAVADRKGREAGSLYNIEDGLLALIDSEEFVPEEQEREFQAALAKQFRKAVAKRDAQIRGNSVARPAQVL